MGLAAWNRALEAGATAPLALETGAWLCALLGLFLLAVAWLARDPFEEQDRQGAETSGRSALKAYRAALFQRCQLALGMVFVLAGVGLGLAEHLRAAPDGARSATVWIGALVLALLFLELVLWWWSRRRLKQQVDRWLSQAGARLENDAALAREVGELFGVASRENDTVQSYAARVRAAAGLPSPPAPRGRQAEVSLEEALAAQRDLEEE